MSLAPQAIPAVPKQTALVAKAAFPKGNLYMRMRDELGSIYERTDSTHVLAAIRALHRRECVGETLRHALNVLATVVPEWLSEIAHPDGFKRYGTRIEASRLPEKTAESEQWVLQVGAIDAEHVVNIPKTYSVELVGPAPSNPSWQAQAAQRFDVAHFTINWQHQQVRCPQGQLNRQWNETVNQRGQPVIRVRFSRKHCQACPSRLECTQAQSQHGRSISLLPYP